MTPAELFIFTGIHNTHAVRDVAMFNLAIDSKLRGCDLVSLRVRDINHGNQVLSRAMVIQRKTQRSAQFELTEPTRAAVSAWLEKYCLRGDQFLFPSRESGQFAPCLNTLVREDSASLGRSCRAGFFDLRNTLDAAYQGNPDLEPLNPMAWRQLAEVALKTPAVFVVPTSRLLRRRAYDNLAGGSGSLAIQLQSQRLQ